MEEELQKLLTEEAPPPAETATTEAPPAPAPAREEAAPEPEVIPPPAPTPTDPNQYLAAMAQQQAYQTQLLAQQMQQMQQHMKVPEKEEELPDPTLEPDKYIHRAVQKQLEQITPMLQQNQMQNAVNTALINREAVKQQLGAEFGKYESVINELASRFPPTAFATPDAWKALYFMAKGADTPQAAPAPATASAPSPQAAQGQWPGAKAPPPPVSSPGRAAPQTAKKPKTYSAEHLKIAEGLGLKPEDLDSEEA